MAGRVAHLCPAPEMRTERARDLAGQMEASWYDGVLGTVKYMREEGLCLLCGFPRDNSAPHPLAAGSWGFRGAARVLLECLTEKEFRAWIESGGVGELPPRYG